MDYITGGFSQMALPDKGGRIRADNKIIIK